MNLGQYSPEGKRFLTDLSPPRTDFANVRNRHMTLFAFPSEE